MGNKFRDIRGFKAMRMNLDGTPETMAPNEFREIYHCHEENSSGRLVNLKGFTNVLDLEVNSEFDLRGDFKCIGTTKDIENSTIIYFLCNISGNSHGIMQMNVETKVLTWVLKSEPLLNFQPNYRIKANVVEGLLYWTDGYFVSFIDNQFSPPRKINIAKAIKYTAAYNGANRWDFVQVQDGYAATGIREWEGMTSYIGIAPWMYAGTESLVAWSVDGINRVKTTSGYGLIWDMRQIGQSYIVTTDRPWQEAITGPINRTGHTLVYEPDMYFGVDWQVMDVIKWKPKDSPTAVYGTDATKNINRLQNKLFQFAYRWVKDDDEKTVFSPISDIPLPTRCENITGIYDGDIFDNKITVTVNTGPIEARRIEILAREGNNETGWRVIHRKYKYDQDDNCLLSSDIDYDYSFYNDEIGESIDQVEAIRPYDFVPLVAKHQEIIEKNRLIYADYLEGFNHTDVNVLLGNHQIEKTFTTERIEQFQKFQYPTQPPGNFTGNYLYSNGVQWYYRVPPISGLLYSKFFGGIRIGFANIPLIPNATYTFTVDSDDFYSYTKTALEETETWWQYPDDNNGDYVGGTAVVTVDANTTMQDLLNAICTSLRDAGKYSNRSAIACTGSEPYAGNLNHVWDRWFDQTIGYEIGNNEIFIPTGNGTGNATVDLSKFTISLTIIPDNNEKYKTQKGGETKELGLEYVERAGRCSFINSSDQCKIYIPSQTEQTPSHKINQNIITWEINHTPPDYATAFRWVMRKRIAIPYYIQCPLYGIDRSTAGQSAFTFLSLSIYQNFTTTKNFFNKFNVQAYEWNAGDRLRFMYKAQPGEDGTTEYRSFDTALDFEIVSVEYPGGAESYAQDDAGDPILDATGNKIKDDTQSKIKIPYFDNEAYGITDSSLQTSKIIVEIYRPGKTVQSDIYYQITPTYDILNPHTANRTHAGGTSETISGWCRNQSETQSARGTIEQSDAYLILRMMLNDTFSASFPCESMSYSDWYDSDAIDLGNVNQENVNASQQWYQNSLRYSGRLVQDTKINEISRFDGADVISLPSKYGAINHIEEVGDELKVIQKHHTSKVLIGRAGVTQPNEEGTQIISSTKDVLGTLIQTRWDYGTVHGGSFVQNNDRGYWFDFYAQCICRDPGNGVQNLSEQYGMKQFMEDKCNTFGTADNVDVIGAYDQQNEFVWWTFIDKTNTANSFTLAFKDTGGRNEDGFVMLAQFIPDEYGESKKVLTAFKDNGLWLMNSDDALRCNFFGVQYKYWVTPVFNAQPLTVKRWLQILISSAKRLSAPNAGDVAVAESGNSPLGMVSLLKPAAFTSIQGKYVADFGKNMITNSSTPKLSDLVNGDDMEGTALTVRLEGDQTTEHKVLAVEVEGVTTGV